MGNALADIFAAVHLTLDGTGFEAQATALADKSGKNVGDKLSAKLNDSLKTAGGAAIGAMFGVAVTAGADLDKAMGQLKADTGMVGDEADNAKRALVGMYQGGIESMAQIGDTMAKVRSDLSLTGDAANTLSEKFVKYETATKQTADAVDAVSKVLKAWNLTAADAGDVMDALVYSHQKYGTNIVDNQAQLAKLAPTLIQANMTWKDGIGLLNMFQAGGLDAAKATVAMTTALSKVKSPEELQRLIADISATADPFERGQKAADLFGKKAGPQMAALLAQGNVEQYTQDVQDYQDATEKAAQAIEDEWGNRAVKVYHDVAGALSEIGSAMGPVMSAAALLPASVTTAITTGFGAFGPKLGSTLGAAIIGDAVQGPVLEGAAGLGRAGGLSMGAAFSSAFALAAVAAVGIAYTQMEADLEKHADETATKAAGWAKTATGDQIKAMRDEITAQKGNIPTIFGWDVFGGKAKVQQSVDALTKEITDREIRGLNADGLQAVLKQKQQAFLDYANANGGILAVMNTDQGVAMRKEIEIIQAALSGMDNAAKATFGVVPTDADKALTKTNTIFVDGLQKNVQAVKDSKAKLSSAWSDALNAQIRPAEIAAAKQKLIGEMSNQDLLNRMNSKNAIIRQAAQTEYQDLQNQYRRLMVEDANYGTNAERQVKLAALLQSDALKAGLASMDDDVALQWALVQAETQTALDQLQGKMDTGGTNMANAYINAIWKRLPWAKDAIDALMSGKAGAGGAAPGGGQTGWQPPATVTTSGGYGGGAGMPARARGGPVEAGYPYLVNENTARSEIFVPQVSGTIVPAGQLGGNVTNIFQFPHYVGSRSELTKAIAQELRLKGG